MSQPQDSMSYLDIGELVVRTGFSEATLWRLKRAGKIPFYQPAGKGGRVKFPEDAIELVMASIEPHSPDVDDDAATPERLPGPSPQWMSPKHQHENP